MSAALKYVRITDDETGEAEVCEFADFIRDNADGLDDTDAEIERYLLEGGIYRIGGGAAPMFLITAVQP